MIEDGVAIPERRVVRKRIEWNGLKDRLPFARLQIGQSFAVSIWDYGGDPLRVQNYISGAACTYRETRVPGSWDFTTRQMRDGTVRCWRIKPEDHKGRGQ